MAASAGVEVLSPPAIDELYFWAMQVSFRNDSRQTGGAHLGLQHHPDYPGFGAVNWGGYDDVEGGILEGTVSDLPSALGNANTRSYSWSPRRRYRYEISRVPDGWWAGGITDVETGVTTHIRSLNCRGAEHLTGLMVWSEVFAPCDAPSVSVRWSALSFVTLGGVAGSPSDLSVNYQDRSVHGCLNTNAYLTAANREIPSEDDPHAAGVVQQTGVTRSTAQGSTLRWSAEQ